MCAAKDSGASVHNFSAEPLMQKGSKMREKQVLVSLTRRITWRRAGQLF